MALFLAIASAGAMSAFGQPAATPKPAASSIVAASAPATASSAAEAKLKGPSPDLQRGTIGSITDLAQQLKVEQLKRDLREARQTAASSSTSEAAIAKLSTLPVPSAKAAAAAVEPTPQERQPPVVTAIFGMGGRLRARLYDGRELVAGQEAQGWTINSVTPSNVSFTHCPAPKKAGVKSECITKLISPTGV